MHISKKIVSLFLIVTTLFCLLNVGVAVVAATPTSQTIKAEAGETITLKFSETAYGVDGEISYDNRSLFSAVTPGSSPYGMVREKVFILSSSDKVELAFDLTVKVSDTAAAGSKCTVTITYLRVDNNMGEGPDGLVKTITVEVVGKSTTTSQDKPTTTTQKPKDPTTTTEPKQPTTTTTPNKPTTSTMPSNLDLTELNKQIGIAEELDEADYTADSWKNLKSALNAAKKARKATTQTAVNSAADKLKTAIAALVRIDNSKLKELLGTVQTFLEEEDLSDVKEALMQAIEEAEEALAGGDQAAIDAAYDKLSAAFEAYKAKLNELGNGQIIEVEKPVEVLPQDPYCNIWLHKLWLILLIVSGILNVIFVVLTVLYFVRRKKNSTDDTPLVDYDINDD